MDLQRSVLNRAIKLSCSGRDCKIACSKQPASYGSPAPTLESVVSGMQWAAKWTSEYAGVSNT